MSQEAIDDANDVYQSINTDFQWDAQNKRLTNVADPTAAQDAATKELLRKHLVISVRQRLLLTMLIANISN